MIIYYDLVAWEYNRGYAVALLCVIHVYGYLHNPNFSQAFEFVDFDRGPNHELVLKYQLQPFGHVGDLITCKDKIVVMSKTQKCVVT